MVEERIKVIVKRAAPEKLSAPRNIRATGGIDPDFAYVEWNAVMECDGACEYNIWLDGVKRTEKAFSPTPGIDLEELDAGRTYKLEIQTKTPSGAVYKTPSDKVSYSFTTPTGAPEKHSSPTGFKLEDYWPEHKEAWVDWKMVHECCKYEGAPRIDCFCAFDAWLDGVSIPTKTRSATFYGLKPNTEYTLEVQTKDTPTQPKKYLPSDKASFTFTTKTVDVHFTPSGYFFKSEEWSAETPFSRTSCWAREIRPGVFEAGFYFISITSMDGKVLCEHVGLRINNESGIWDIDKSNSDDCLVNLFTSVGSATGITLTVAPEVTCDKPTPHYGSGCKLLIHYDDDNDGILDVTDSVKAKIDGMAEAEVDFIKKSIMKGSINALCPGCYTATPEYKKLTMTTNSPIPLLYCEKTPEPTMPWECWRIPTTMNYPLGVDISITLDADGKCRLVEVPGFKTGRRDKNFDVTITDTTCGAPTGRYAGTVTVDLDAGTLNVNLTKSPRPDVNITVDSPIPLFYRDENDVYPLPVEKSCLFDLGFAICDGRHPKDECWSGTEEVEIYKDYITDYTGVVNKTINIRGYRGTVRIDFTTIPYTMHVVITDYPTITPKPVTITPSELRWTNGTYRASFAIGNLVPSKKYILSVRMGRHDKTVNSKTIDGVTSYDITTDIPKSEFDATGYTLSCKVYNYTDREWEKTEEYIVPPYTVKGNVDIGRSTIPTTIYLEESAVFDMMVENTGDREKEYAVILTFKNVDTGDEFKFTPEYTIRVPARGAGANRVSVIMPSESVPVEKETQSFDLVYKLEIW